MDTNNKQLEKLATAEFNDIWDNPSDYGMPSFDECVKKPELLLGREDEVLAQADKGSVILKEVTKHKYYMEGYECQSLHEVERIARNMGYNLRDLDYVSELKWGSNGKYINEVRYFHKDNLKKRKDWR